MNTHQDLGNVYTALAVWNAACAVLVFLSIFSPWVSTWPRYIRMTYASIAAVLIAEALMYGLRIETLTNPWWAIKDISLGVTGILIVRHIYLETRKITGSSNGLTSNSHF
jgi:hypothetical protein